MEQLFVLGLNHTTAPLAVRERLAFNDERARAFVQTLQSQHLRTEVVLLSTCNRVEMYVATETAGAGQADAFARQLLSLVGSFHDVPIDDFAPHVYVKTGREMIEHAFAVAASLDSMVLGETQILGQFRQSYELARELHATGGRLDPLFQRALAVGKQVQSQTSIGDGRLSVASVAVDYARRIFEKFDDKTILSIGAGKMASLLLKNFAALQPGKMLVCNRDPNKAAALARECGGMAVPYESLTQHLASADIVCSSTGATRPILTKPDVQAALKARRYRPMFLLDIAVPRDVEAAVAELEQVYLYNIDDLQSAVSSTQARRGDAVVAAEAIVRRHVDEFVAQQSRRELGPAIDAVYKRYHALAKAEVDRAAAKMPDLSDAQRAQIDELARRIVNKLLHDPIKSLQAADSQHSLSSQYIHALSKLFDLDSPPVNDEP